MALRPQALLDILAKWCGELGGRQVMIDGKALRGTTCPTAGKARLHLLLAWVSAADLSAGHTFCSEKSNELEALPRLLAALRL